ncbi:MAG: bifunctional 4-hydroxy-2-oxoglutarate aldolase/2-dehydro-3-deoxy-phosphogluconate aldolase [Saprospiraceae bacterium]|nr:bifunctional 4-hydroxy-2-oxoglutarate aldolase/2-dehydro-3-deoxy-phosphogluconate aldolase [Saprospiraceae bacterium]
MSTAYSEELFKEVPIVGIVRGIKFEDLQQLLPVYRELGFTTIEITMNTEGVSEMINYAANHFSGKLNVGAGSVRSMDELKQALAAGAQFIVTPILNRAVVEYCRDHEVPIFPGAYTPTEVYNAWQYGATAVKIFPSVTGGLTHIKAIQAPLEMVPLLPTGGISAQNLASYLDVGVFGVGLGGALFPRALIAKQDLEAVGKTMSEMMHAFRVWKASV